MKKFKYTGKCEHCATIVVDSQKRDIRLSPDMEYELPEGHAHIKKLLSTGLLIDPNNTYKK